jgi:hypothetical protein
VASCKLWLDPLSRGLKLISEDDSYGSISEGDDELDEAAPSRQPAAMFVKRVLELPGIGFAAALASPPANGRGWP